MTSNYSASIEQPTVSNRRAILGVSHLFRQSSSQRLNPTFNFKSSSQTGFDPVKATSGGKDAIAPKAKLVKTNITTPGSTYTFKVIYTDRGGIKKTTINSKDILVSGPSGFRKLATRVGLASNRSATRVVATYRMAAVGGTWDATDNGIYTISMQRKQVSDKSGNFVRSGKLGTFAVSLPGVPSPSPGPSPVPGPSPSPGPSPTPSPSGDQILPTASIQTLPQINAGAGAAYISITYTDNAAIKASSLGTGDIIVSPGPGGTSQGVLVSLDASSDGASRTATYRFYAPGGTWDAADNGTYTIFLQANQVSDINGNFAAEGSIGTFQVNITGSPSSSDNTVNGTSSNDWLFATAGDDTVNGGSGSDTVDYSLISKGISANLGQSVVLKPLYGGIYNPKIMPLGDSITSGQHANAVPGAYRTQLWTDFGNDGISINFVGTQTNINPPPSLGDLDNEGYPGASIAIDASNNILDRVQGDGNFSGSPSILTSNPADVILLMIGTNDTNTTNNRSVSQMLTDLSTLIDEITTRLPNAELIISSTPPIGTSSSRNTKLQTYSAGIPDLVATKVAQGKKVSAVNAGGQLSLNDLGADDIHPTEAGYTKLGNFWYDEIAGRDTLNSIENIIGTAFVDTIIGSSGDNVIEGGKGSDRLTGNGGADTFVYRSANEGTDTITDFISSNFIQISASGFGGGLVAGVGLAAGVASATGTFVEGTTPVGTGANFLYSNGILSFDADGTGAGAAVNIATLSGSPSLTAIQFSIVA